MEAARAKMALVRAERAAASVQQMQSRADEQMQLHDRVSPHDDTEQHQT